ncbi:MAG: hypothetical protein V9F04_07635 [Dermatophilaceae bacterium]
MIITSDRPGVAMAAAGSAAIVAGGLVAAVTGPLALTRGSWAAAYLVLVWGVGQAAMAAARLVAPPVAPGHAPGHAPGLAPGQQSGPGPGRRGWHQLVIWNLANGLVIAGTLAASPWVVDIGGLGCVAALVLAWSQARPLPRGAASRAYRAVLALMAVSIPVGLLLTHVRNAR